MNSALLLILTACHPHSQMDTTAQRITRTASISVHEKIENIFPLFGAFEERKWADGWNPVLIYPAAETMGEGTTFRTAGNGEEKEFLWRVTRYEPQQHLVQYLVSTENRYWTITVNCSPADHDITTAEITYTYIGLNSLGNALNSRALEKMYSQNLKDWEKAINHFLETGKILKDN